MPPKFRFSEKEIVNAGLSLLREGGMQAVTARAVGEKLGSSSKVIFTSFANMEEFHTEVIKAAMKYYEACIISAMDKETEKPYMASGKAYIKFASGEKEIFRLLFMRDRSRDKKPPADGTLDRIAEEIIKKTGFTKEDALRLHMDLSAAVHGLAVMQSTGFSDFKENEIERILSDIFLGVKFKITEEGGYGSDKNR